MKKAIKKIAAVAMAFTMLGTGTAVTKTIAPQFDNSITASAKCNHEGYRRYEYVGDWQKVEGNYNGTYCVFWIRCTEYRCVNCNKAVTTKWKHTLDDPTK